MMNNDTPADPSDDFIAILGTRRRTARRAGYPQLTIPMGYNDDAAAHAERLDPRQRVQRAQPDRRRVRDRAGARSCASRSSRSTRACTAARRPSRRRRSPSAAPATRTTSRRMKLVGGARRRCRSRWRPSRRRALQDRLTAGTLTAETLTKAYLARIALTNAEGPALQAVRSLNTQRGRRGEGARRASAPPSGVARPAARHPGAARRHDRRARAADHGRLDRAAELDAGATTPRSSPSSRRRARSCSARRTSPSSTACSTRTCRRATRRSAARCCCRPTPTRRRPAPRRARRRRRPRAWRR